MGFVDFSSGKMRLHHPKSASSSGEAPSSFEECLDQAEAIFKKADGGHLLPDQRLSFNSESAELRWFLLPSEAQEFIHGSSLAPQFRQAPFTPRQYASRDSPFQLEHYSTILSQRRKNLIQEEEQQVEQVVQPIEDEEEKDFTDMVNLFDEEDSGNSKSPSPPSLWKSPVRSIMKPTLEALVRHKMIRDGDRVLVCISGGKDSLSLLHTLRQYQQQSRRFGISFEMGAVTVVS